MDVTWTLPGHRPPQATRQRSGSSDSDPDTPNSTPGKLRKNKEEVAQDKLAEASTKTLMQAPEVTTVTFS